MAPLQFSDFILAIHNLSKSIFAVHFNYRKFNIRWVNYTNIYVVYWLFMKTVVRFVPKILRFFLCNGDTAHWI